MNTDKRNEIQEAKRAYHREWRKRNPERVAKINERYWERKAAEMRSKNAAGDPGSGGHE